MNNFKTTALALAALLALGGLSACSKSNVGQNASNPGQPLNQTFGKSYVKQIPESETAKKENEMTAPNQADKGPALGSKDAYSKNKEMQDKQKHANQ